MAVMTGFEHDMFVSYAHLDNVPARERRRGWVDTLVQDLQREVRQRLGRKEFIYWMDYQIDENRPLSDEIIAAIRKSATLLVVMSPTYLNSVWCRRERTNFLGVIAGRAERGDVFVVEQLSVDRSKYPPELGQPKAFKFWTADPHTHIARTLEFGPGASSALAEQYTDSVVHLAEKVAKHVRSRLKAIVPGTVRKETGPAPCVYVSQSTEDLEEREEELKAYLEQMGIHVLPDTYHPRTSAAEFEKAMAADLERCKAYVQLLSVARGHKLDFAPEHRLVGYQHALAARSEKPMLLWRDPGLDLSTIEDEKHRALLESARASGMEEFKRAVFEEAHRAPPPARREPTKVMVFVNADAADRELARNVGKALNELTDLEVYYPLTSGTPEEVRTDFEETLRNCDGALLIYGKTGASWIRRQLQQSRKVIAQRERPLDALAVFQGPPPEDKGDLGVEIPNLITLDCRQGVNSSTLKQFVENLQR